MNSIQLANEPYYYFIYYYRKTIPKNPVLFYIFIVVKFISVYMITHNIEDSGTSFISFSFLLQKESITASLITSLSIEYSSLSLFINCLLIIIVVIILLYIHLIKKAQSNSDLSLYNIQNTKFSLGRKAKSFLTLFIYFYCLIVFFSQFIIEYLSYSYFFIYPYSNNSYFIEKYLVALNHYKTGIVLNKYLLCILNSIGIIIILALSYFFLLCSSHRTITTSYGVQVNATHKRVIALLLIFHLHVCYSVTHYFIPSYKRQIRFGICLAMMALLLIILLLHYHVYNISTSRFGLVICFLCDWCLISAIIEVIMYLANTRALNYPFDLMKLVFEVCNAIFLTVGIIARNKSIALKNFQKCLFSNHKIKTLNYSLIEYFILVQQSCESRKKGFVWFYDFLINHRQFCTNDRCQCKKNNALNSITPQSKPESILQLLTVLGEELIVSSITRPSSSQLPLMQEYYLLHVDFLISIKKQYFLSFYLCQYYLHQKTKWIDFLYGYYLYEINKLIFSKFKGKRLDHTEQHNHIAKNQKKISEIMSTPKRLLFEQFKMEKIRQMIYFCIVEFEKLMNYRNVKNKNKKITFTEDNIFLPLHSLLKTRKNLLKLIEAYAHHQEFATVEIYYIISYAFDYLFDKSTQKQLKKLIPHITNYEMAYDSIESCKYNYMIIFLEPDDRFLVRYASVNLIEKLCYKKKEFIGINFNELLPKQIANEHFAEMKKFFSSENTKYGKDTFLLTKNQNLIKIHVKCRNLPTASHFFSMIFKISTTKKQEKDMILYSLLLNESFKFISTSLNFEKHFFFSIRMLEVLRIDFCQLFGLNSDSLGHRFKGKRANKLKALDDKRQIVNYSILTSIKQEYQRLYEYSIDYHKRKKQKEAPMTITEVVSKNKTLNEIQKIEYNIQELEKEWKDRILDLYNRLKANKETEMTVDEKKKTTNFFINIELKSIGYLFYYVVLIKEEVSKSELTLIQYNNELSNTPKHVALDASQFKTTAYLKNTAQVSIKSLFNLDNSMNNSSSNNTPGLVKTPNTITSSMNVINSSLPTSANMVNHSSSKIGLVTHHDAKLMHLSRKNSIKGKKKPKPKQQQIDVNETNEKAGRMKKINKGIKVIKYLNYLIFFIVLALLASNFISNTTTTQFSIDLFNVNTYSFLLKADIYFSSLGIITTCLLKDKIRKGSLQVFSERVKTRALDLLGHHNQLLNNINLIVHHYQAKELYTLFYSEDDYCVLKSDWTYYMRKSSFGEEIYFLHMSLTQFDLLKEDSHCRVKEFFYNQQFTPGRAISFDPPSAEEKYLFFVFFNVINKLSKKMDQITMKTNQIVQENNDQSQYLISIFNWLILTFVAVLYLLLFITITLFYSKIKYDMIRLFEPKIFDEVLRYQLCLFRQLIEDFGKADCKIFEEMIQFKAIATDTLIHDTKFLIKKLSQSDCSSLFLNNTREFQNKHTITAQDLADNEESSLANKDFQKVIAPKRTRVIALFNLLFFICFLICQIVTIIFKQNSFTNLMIQNDFAINYLSRIPKFGELELYAVTSVIFNDKNYLTTDYEDYNKGILANFYTVELNMLTDSLFNSLGTSHFSFIYYQLFITRKNIQLFTFDNSLPLLQRSKDLEKLFNTKDNFCIYMPYYFILFQIPDLSTVRASDIYSSISQLTKECRVTCNGINLSGSKGSADSVIRLLCDLYIEHFRLDERDPNSFFMNENYLLIDEDLQLPLKKLHNVNSYVIREEIQAYYQTNQSIDIIFSIFSLICSCGFILIILFLLKNRIEKYGNVIVEMNDLLEIILNNINNK